jgi:hypothetical protein
MFDEIHFGFLVKTKGQQHFALLVKIKGQQVFLNITGLIPK